MKILIVTSSTKGKVLPFVQEQVDNLRKDFSLEIDYFFIQKKGIFGYLQESVRLKRFLKSNPLNYTIVHGHYGLSGLVACLQTGVKKIITFHGSDINYLPHRIISQFASLLSDKTIFISEELSNKIYAKDKSIIPCGIDLNNLIIDKDAARKKLNWLVEGKYILFSSSFKRREKNPKLAFEVIHNLKKLYKEIELIELDGYTREEVSLLMSASDFLLLTSDREGSPQVIKEAVFFKLPIVSRDVGTIKKILADVDQTFVVETKKQLIDSSKKLLETNSRIKNNKIVFKEYDNAKLTKKIYEVYRAV